MAHQSLNRVLHHLRQVAAAQTNRGLSDRELLDRFVGSNDESAFTVLIERHGPMALGVCLRALPNIHDAEDACQATFLVLARKAALVRKKSSLGSWLHGVACRVAANLKRDHARRKSREQRVDAPVPRDPAGEVTWREVQAILDQELQQLPERYRTPLILCYLECMTRDQAAQQIGVSAGSLHGRLERARDMLRERLTRRGLTLSAAMSAAVLCESVAQAALAPTFVVTSTRAALLLAAGQPLTDNVVAAHVLVLTQEVLKTMFMAKLKLGTAAVLCIGLAAALIGGSFTSLGFAQDGKVRWSAQNAGVPREKAETDAQFIRRISKDLRGTEPTPTEIHFFVASKDAARRQKLIDLFIQERQAKEKEHAIDEKVRRVYPVGDLVIPSNQPLVGGAGGEQRFFDRVLINHGSDSVVLADAAALFLGRIVKSQNEAAAAGLGTLQEAFYKELHAAKEQGDVAKITQKYLDSLIDLVKRNPKSQGVADAMQQIAFIYASQGKTVEASAWREKLLQEYPKTAAGNVIDKSTLGN